jgi:hypothetical protein
VASDTLLLVMTAVVTLRYGLSADAFLDVVHDANNGGALTGDAELAARFSPTRAAASALAAAGALDAAMRTLQARAAQQQPARDDTAAALSSYFTLQAAEQDGFQPGALALSERDALRAARAFDAADTNADGCIDAKEMRALMCAAAAALGVALPLSRACAL